MTPRPAEWLGRLVGGQRPEPTASGQPAQGTPRRKHPAPTLPEAQLRTAWQLTSLLLGYPDERVAALLPAIREVLGADVATDEVLSAWGEAYWMLADILIAAEALAYEDAEAA